MHLEKKLCIKKKKLSARGGTLMLGGGEDGFFRELHFRGGHSLPDNALLCNDGLFERITLLQQKN